MSRWPRLFRLESLGLVLLVFLARQGGQVLGSKYSWMWYDHFDEVDDHIRTVNSENCMSKSKEEMVLRPDVVSQLPVYNRLLNHIWYHNRTSLIHMHNMALNRAFFYSFILQRMNDTTSFKTQPNWLYMYMSAVADVNSNPDTINGSAIYFDTDTHYPNWYQTVPFNNTLKLFGPKAWQHDDTRDPGNILREPTKRVANVRDIGADGNYTHPGFKMNPWYGKWLPDTKGDMDSLTKFTYYVAIKKSNRTGKFEKNEFEQFNFFGPSSPSAEEGDEHMLPVVWSQPYFDCGRSNEWVLSAVSPVVDYMPRYSNWTHLRRQRFVAVVVMDILFKNIDFNACDVGTGNPGPSYVSGIHRCRQTTSCKHKMGYGWKRGGYTCPCKAGTQYPWGETPPWDGAVIEQALDDEYYNSFKCSPSNFLQVLPNIDLREGVRIVGESNAGSLDISSLLVSPEFRTRNLRWSVNETHEGRSLSYRSQSGGQQPASVEKGETTGEIRPLPVVVPYGVHAKHQASHDRKHIPKDQKEATIKRRVQEVEQERSKRQMAKTTRKTDLAKKTDHVAASTRKKREVRFDPKAFDRVMRIFRQKETITGENCHKVAPHNRVMPGDVAYGVHTQFEFEARTALRLAHFLCLHLQNSDPDENFGNLRGGGRIHTEHLFGEAVANVLGNHKISSSGVYFDKYQFENQDGTQRELFGPWAYRKQGAVYVIDTAGLNARYTDEEWFRSAKGRWATNQSGLKTYKMQAYIRADTQGSGSIKHEHYPLRYQAPHYESGHWTRPHFRCDGKVDAWVITYVVPFFGLDTHKRRLKFKGVVTMDVPLSLLEINPCPMSFGVANAFKNTAHCDSFSTSCSTIAGYPFMRGAYSCKCRQGFEYPFFDGREWFQGSLVESEWEKKVRGLFSSYDQLYCRVSGSQKQTPLSWHLIVVCLVVSAIATISEHR